MKPSQYLKAIYAAVVAFLGALSVAIDGGISAKEWLAIASAVVVSGGGVFMVPNKAPSGQPQDPNLSEQAGQGVVELILLVLGVVLILAGALNIIFGLVQNYEPRWVADIIMIVIGLIMVGYTRGRRGIGL